MQAATNLASPIFWQTNLIYDYGTNGPPGPGGGGSGTVTGTNVFFNGTTMRFYRAATAP